MLLQQKLKESKETHSAVLAANFYNLETLKGILEAARIMQMPVILQLSESSIQYIGLEIATNMAKTALHSYGVEGWLHLDHSSSLELVARCLDAGFDSVMIDASEKSFTENVKISLEAVVLASAYHANVEAELGFIAKLGQDSKSSFTSPEDARRFVEETGVDALAVAIGSAHGFYKQAPNLEIRLLAQINSATSAPLVLHGSSGIPDKMLQEAVRNGITKVNLATETKNIFMQTLKKILLETDEIDLRKVFPKANSAVVQLIANKMRVIKESN